MIEKTVPPPTKIVITKPAVPAKVIVKPVIDSVPKEIVKHINQDSIDNFALKEEARLKAEESEKLIAKEKADAKKVKLDEAIKEKKLKKELAAKEKLKNKKAKENDLNNHTSIKTIEEPGFGDMVDSSRGIVREKEQTKKSTKENSTTPVGWNKLILKNVNPDSLKNHRSQTQKDSLKKSK